MKNGVLILLGACWIIVTIWVVSHSSGAGVGQSSLDNESLHSLRREAPHQYRNAIFELIEKSSLRFFVIGDFGTGLPQQKTVSDAMQRTAKRLKPMFVISTGDQIYPHGAMTATDSAFQEKFEDIYPASWDIPWYITLGNHDCEGNVSALIDYAANSSRWNFPSRYYSVDFQIDSQSALRTLVLDTCSLVCQGFPPSPRCNASIVENNYASGGSGVSSSWSQYNWIQDQLRPTTTAEGQRLWKIVVGHWGVFSFAGNGPTETLINILKPLMEGLKTHAYFSGHDHSLQHISNSGQGHTIEYFVSGAGGYDLHPHISYPFDNEEERYFASQHGFMAVGFAADKMFVAFVGKDADILYHTSLELT